ncbi:MAG: thiolase family protein [Verrucomicrobia bacterium]|nr:thiolase family protein [Verrucomicrobiota bacterium]
MKYTQPIHIVAARRSPIGRFGGALKSLSAAELAEQVCAAMLDRDMLARVESVICGQVLQAGSGMNVARQIALRIGIAQTVPACTINMVCASGLKAVALGADAIASGEANCILAAGAESMSQAPYYVREARWGRKLGHAAMEDCILTDGLTDPVLKLGMGETVEKLAETCRISREDQDRFALRSQERATREGAAFRREIVPIRAEKGAVGNDEHPRPDTTLDKLRILKPAFRSNGTVTAGNSSGINDGAAAVLLAGDRAVRERNWPSRARVVATAAVGCDPMLMGLGPIHAIRSVLAQTGWKIEEVDAIEINEAFAAQTLACVRDLGIRDDQINLRGGAIALGHPIGCSGTRILVTLLHLMEDNDFKRGIASLCVGGGMGIAMAIERAPQT